MFSKIFIALLSVSALSLSIVTASPVKRDLTPRYYSLDSYGGYSSMSDFDNFYSSNNFDGSHNTQTVIENNVVCHTEEIEVIQQRLAILREMAKRIITEQICEVETQTIVLSQFSSSMDSFSHDLYRNSGNYVGYDSYIAGMYNDIMGSDGSLSNSNLGFSGSSVGSHYVAVGGNNWGSNSEQSVYNAGQAAQEAYQSSSRFA